MTSRRSNGLAIQFASYLGQINRFAGLAIL